MNRNALVAILVVLLAGSLGYNAYQYTQTAKANKTTKDLAQLTVMNDSLKKEIKRMEDSLKPLLSSYQEENSRLTGKIEELEPQVAEVAALRSRIAALQSLSNQTTEAVQNVNEKIAKGQKPTKKELAEITELKDQIAAKQKEIDDLKSQLELASQQRDAFQTEAANEHKVSDELKDRVTRGAVPQYGSLLTSGITKKGDQQVETFKAKSVQRLKITFDILDNSLIREPVEEEVTIRIIGPEGEVLCTNPNLTDKSKLFSIRQTITCDGEGHPVKWYYPNTGTTGKLKKGKYTTELWARDKIMVKNTFELN